MDERASGPTDRQTDRQIGSRVGRQVVEQKHREADRLAARQAKKWTDRQTDRLNSTQPPKRGATFKWAPPSKEPDREISANFYLCAGTKAADEQIYCQLRGSLLGWNEEGGEKLLSLGAKQQQPPPQPRT